MVYMGSSMQSSPMETPGIAYLLRHSSGEKRSKFWSGGGVLKVFKLLPLMLSSGCKMVGVLGRPRKGKAMVKDKGSTGTIFGYRKGRVSLAIQEDPHSMPIFLIELPMHTSALNKEMASGMVRIALESESESKNQKKNVLEECVWGVYCNGRKVGYSIRRKEMNEEEANVMQRLRGVSMGAGVLPSHNKQSGDGEMTYMRATFERLICSNDSEAFYIINPIPHHAQSPEFSIFFLRLC